MKLPYDRRAKRLKTTYSQPRNPSGKNTRRFVQLRLTNRRRQPFFQPFSTR